jgi:cytosine permease
VAADEYMNARVPHAVSIPWWRVALMNSIFSLTMPAFISGLQLAASSPADNFLLGLLGGGVLLAAVAGVMGAIGSMTRLSSYMLTRIAFGARGAVLVNLSLAVSLLGWFGVNINLFGVAIIQLLQAYHIGPVPAWPVELAGGVLMTWTTVIGLKAIDRLSLLLTPVLLVVAVMMFAAVLKIGSLQAVLAHCPRTGLSLGDNLSAIVGGSAVGAVITPDLARFVRHWFGSVLGAVITYVLSASAVIVIGGLAGLATGSNDMLKVMVAVGLGAGAFVTMIGGSWIINALNLYSSVLSISTSVPRMRRATITLLCGLGGTVAAFFNILDHFITFLFYLAIVFVPVAGVIVVDVFVMRPDAYHAPDALDGLAPYQWSAIAAWAIGAVVAMLASHGLLTLTRIAALDSILVAAAARLALGWAAGTAAGLRPARPPGKAP